MGLLYGGPIVMNDDMLTAIAKNVLEAFLPTLGLLPSVGGDTLEILDFGPHRVFTQQARVPDSMVNTIDPGDVLAQLVDYIDHHNVLPTAVKFEPYDAEVYVCPCGCGTFLYVSVSHTADT